jgi:hypothetical protein
MAALEVALATAVDRLPEVNYLYQPKFDGWRTLVRAPEDDGDGSVTLRSRSGRRLDAYFPDLRRVARGVLPPGTTLDGELVAWGAEGTTSDGTTSFAALQRRLVAGRTLSALAARWPAHMIVFDVLAAVGEGLCDLPLTDRLARLAELLAGAPDRLVLCPSTRDLAEARAWTTTMASLGVEGVLAKPASAPYRPGRSRSGWVKWKVKTTTEAIVGGATGPRTAPETLLLGRYDATGRLRLVGRSSPLSPRLAAEIGLLLQPAGAGRQRVQHPWPRPLPAGWLGRWGGRAEPLSYQQLTPDLVVEIVVDTAPTRTGWPSWSGGAGTGSPRPAGPPAPRSRWATPGRAGSPARPGPPWAPRTRRPRSLSWPWWTRRTRAGSRRPASARPGRAASCGDWCALDRFSLVRDSRSEICQGDRCGVCCRSAAIPWSRSCGN